MKPQLQNEQGWFGAFTRQQALGAIPNGAIIEKVLCGPGDAHPIGTLGTVLGSIVPKPVQGFEQVKHFYFVEWACQRRVACGVTDYKIRRRTA